MTEVISRNENQKLGLMVTVSYAGIEPAKSVKEMEAALTEHVVDCRRCLAMILFREETLAEVGCEKYKILLASMHAACSVRASLASGGHIDENTLEEYCFNRLSPDESSSLKKHIGVCAAWSKNLEHRLEFIACMKDTLRMLEDHDLPEGMGGALAIHCPERQVSVYAAISSY